MTAIDREALKARIGPKADYYLRRFEKIDSGIKAGWNWPAFFLSTAWFSYRGMGGWAALNLVAPWLGALLATLAIPVSGTLGMAILFAYPIAFFILVPMYADALYYERVKRAVAHAAEGGKPSSPTRPIAATIVGLAVIVFPALLAAMVVPIFGDYGARANVSEAISLLGGAKTPLAEHFADKGKWPDKLEPVVENTRGKYTERVEITSGAGAASGVFVITATMKKDGVRSAVAGKTVQLRSEDGGKTWTCRRGTVNGVEEKYLPGTCR